MKIVALQPSSRATHATAWPWFPALAATISLRFGVAKLEHPLHDLANRAQRVEPAALNLVQQPPQLRIVGHRTLEVRLRARRRYRENLPGEVAAALLLQPAVALEERSVLLDLLPQLGDVLATGGFRQDDRRPPGALAVEGEHRAHLVQHRLGGRMVELVDRDHVRDLHDPRLQRLDRVPGAGHQDEHDRVRDRDHFDFALAGTDRLEEDELLAGRVEHEHRLQSRLREAALMAARAHRADEDARIEEVVGEANPVAEERAL